MADNVQLSAGTADGIVLATDDIGGTHYQIVKMSFGALDTATPVSAANPLPVVQTGTLNVGTVTAVTAISNALPAGNNNIGDVDVVTVPTDPFGANADAASATGSISAKLRFIASTGIPITGTATVTGAGGTFPVTDSAGSLTVDAPVATPVFVRLSDGAAAITNLATNVAQLAGTTTDTNSGTKSAGTLRVVLATDQPQLTNKLLVTPDANSAVNCAQIAGTSTAVNNGTASAGCQRVTIASDNTAFTVNAAQSGTWTVQPGNTANTTAWLTTSSPATSGGLTVATGSITATATSIKGSAGQVYGWYFYNPNASVAYVQFFNTASGSVTLGTTTPVYSLGIPATSAANVELSNGVAHSTAITIAVTTTRAGSTSPGSSVDYNIFYK